MEEWYHVDGHMLRAGALEFSVAGAGVLMPPPGARDAVAMGWVESGGVKGGQERLVAPRDLRATGTGLIQGIPTVQWESRFDARPSTWHDHGILLTEEIRFDGDPKTGWILTMERRVLVEMTPEQALAFFGLPVPIDVSALQGGPATLPIMELVYRTTPAGVDAHVAEDRTFRAMMAPIDAWAALAWSAVAAGVVAAAAWFVMRRRHRRDERRAAGGPL